MCWKLFHISVYQAQSKAQEASGLRQTTGDVCAPEDFRDSHAGAILAEGCRMSGEPLGTLNYNLLYGYLKI